jgi:hypothetical protein
MEQQSAKQKHVVQLISSLEGIIGWPQGTQAWVKFDIFESSIRIAVGKTYKWKISRKDKIIDTSNTVDYSTI